MSTPLRPPLAPTRPCATPQCTAIVSGRAVYCPTCRAERVAAQRRKYWLKFQAGTRARLEVLARLDRIEAKLDELRRTA